MKVVAFNGSPRKGGNCGQCLDIIGVELGKQGIDLEVVQVGNQPVRGCVACYTCMQPGKEGRCVQDSDPVNGWMDKMREADGIILASPVYYGGINGTMKCFLDRAFLVCGSELRLKPGAALTTLRRSGGLETYNQLLTYMTTMEMFIVTSNYWGAVHGLDVGEVQQDPEGLEVMAHMGQNLAYILKLKEAAGDKVAVPPAAIPRTMTNFIR